MAGAGSVGVVVGGGVHVGGCEERRGGLEQDDVVEVLIKRIERVQYDIFRFGGESPAGDDTADRSGCSGLSLEST